MRCTTSLVTQGLSHFRQVVSFTSGQARNLLSRLWLQVVKGVLHLVHHIPGPLECPVQDPTVGICL